MPLISESAATICFYGDDLDPAQISEQLGGQPSFVIRKGEPRKSRREKIARTGRWMLSAENREPADLNGQINELFDSLTDDLLVWSSLSERFDARVCCGLFLESINEELAIGFKTLARIVERGLYLDLDVYGAGERLVATVEADEGG